MDMKRVLSIAGTDPTGGAGMQADIKTITAHKMFAMSVVTALVAQNTMGVYGVIDTPPEFVGQQMDCVMNDIFPDAVKIGMVSSPAIIEKIVEKLKEYQPGHIVVDPVMVSTSGGKLLSDDAMDALIGKLIPMAEVITPNIPEAEVLCGGSFEIRCWDDMVKAAEQISTFYKGNILIKGGHLEDSSDDLLYHDGKVIRFAGERVDNPNTHGTGCTLSSAIACNLAAGKSVEESIREAKSYITYALKANLNLGKGRGPLNHRCRM